MMTPSHVSRAGSGSQPAFVGSSPPMQALHLDIESAARSHAKVLLTGETGVGKEVVARTIHDRSSRQTQPFVTINCAGVPDSLLESELFGHTRGSFTDAYRDSPGLLRQAHRGTVFLDEIGETSLRMQALMLRFLETGEVQTIGGGATRAPVDVRVITATNRDLAEAVAAREFREDLFYRLNVLHLNIPPLRERGADIKQLLEYYLEVFAEQHRVPVPTLSRPALDLLTAYAWPGNVRELRNVVERLILRVTSPAIDPIHIPQEIVLAAAPKSDDSARQSVSHQQRIAVALDRLLNQKESFWTVVYPLFMSRDMTRDDLRFIVRTGLEHTRGSYRVLLDLFHMEPGDYKRFLGFLRQHDCHLPFQRFRMLNPGPSSGVRRPPSAVTAS